MRHLLSVVVAALLGAAATSAAADSPAQRGDRLLAAKKYRPAVTAFKEARHAAADYDYSCELALAFAGLGEAATAHLYFEICAELAPAKAGERRFAHSRARLAAVFTAGEFAPVTIAATPATARVYIDSLDAITFTVPRRVWLARGSHTVAGRAPGYYESGRQVIIYGNDPVTVNVDLEAVSESAAGHATTVDFGDEAAGEMNTSEDLPDLDHDTLLPKRFRRGGVATRASRRQRSRLAYGIAVGANRAQLTGSTASGDASVGLAATVVVGYRLSHELELRSGIGFAMRGNQIADIDYVTIPILARYRLWQGAITFGLCGGTEIAVATAGELDGEDVAAFDVALVIGVGSEVAVASLRLTADLRYGWGMTSVDASRPVVEAKNRALSVLAGALF